MRLLLLLLSSATCSASRLDAALVSRGLCTSRAIAKSAIVAGQVSVDGMVVTKASHTCGVDAKLAIAGEVEGRFVSRAGEKLQRALDAFDISLFGAHTLDIGASTGGFTDCMLAAGAASVVAVDNGHNQLHAKLRDDKRVCSFEGGNARSLTTSQLPRMAYDFIAVDVSFISLELVLPALWPLLDPQAPSARLVALVKPQFEAGRHLGDRGLKALKKGKGVLMDRGMQVEALSAIVSFAGRKLDRCDVVGTIESPISGGDGNREFLMVLAYAEHTSTRGPFVDQAQATSTSRSVNEVTQNDGLLPVDGRSRRMTSAARAAAHQNHKRRNL